MRATVLPSAIILTGCGQYDGQGVYCHPSTIPLRCFGSRRVRCMTETNQTSVITPEVDTIFRMIICTCKPGVRE